MTLQNSNSNEDSEPVTLSEPKSEPLSFHPGSSLEKRLPAWRFFLPLLLQIGVIISVPAAAFHTHLTGKTVILQTAPVDPYSLLQGYYQILSYDISSEAPLKRLPGWKDLPRTSFSCPKGQSCEAQQVIPAGTPVYVILEAPKTQDQSGRPLPWKPVAVSAKLPENVSANQVVLQGKYHYSRIEYGLETYYMPESQREQVNADINATQSQERQAFVVEIKVNSQGKAIPVSLWVRDKNYRF